MMKLLGTEKSLYLHCIWVYNGVVYIAFFKAYLDMNYHYVIPKDKVVFKFFIQLVEEDGL